ncbi:MAG: chemotaxis protein CheB [Archangium sp.]|nr:chemotaxis protein CheB [Archangium sp.]
MSSPIRVLVADDSPAQRRLVCALLERAPGLEVIAEARDGLEAVEKVVRLRPDVVTMDVQMPGLNGLDATATIMSRAPSRIIIICAVSEVSQVALSFQAMNAGALELIAKPDGTEDVGRWGARVVDAIRLMSEVPVVGRRRPDSPALPATPSFAHRAEVVGLAASTGGPPALARILGALPCDFAPILVAQHIAPGFTPGLTRWLQSVVPLRIVQAVTGAVPQPGTVTFAPDGCDLEVDLQGTVRFRRATGTVWPSGDRLLSSLAASFGPRAAGVVLTGMGEDGAQGLLALRRRGGATFAQDAESSVVYGMPRAAWQLEAASAQLPLEQIAPMLIRVWQGRGYRPL